MDLRQNRPSLNSILLLLLALLLLFALACANPLNNGDGHARRGIAAYEAGSYDEAVQELQQAIAKGVTLYELAEIHTILGNAYLELNQFDQAIEAHKKALELDPALYKAWVNLGVVYRQTGDLDRAEESYNQALQLNPDYAELHASLGVLYIVKDDAPKAVESLEKAVELDPQLAIAHGNLALAYALVGRFDEAEASLKQATALGYKNSAVIQERIDDLKSLR